MAKKTQTADQAKTPTAAEQAATPTPAEQTAETQAPNTDVVDSLGQPKDGTPVGPVARTGKNAKVVVPVGLKADPPAKVKGPVDTVTDKADSAGNEIQDEHSYVPGPRGPHAEKHVLDSYRRS